MLSYKLEPLPNGGSKVQTSSGTYYYDFDNQYHREDGPAKIMRGCKFWFLHGKRHRLDGPAREGPGFAEWYVNGIRIACSSQQEFEKLLKFKAFW